MPVIVSYIISSILCALNIAGAVYYFISDRKLKELKENNQLITYRNDKNKIAYFVLLGLASAGHIATMILYGISIIDQSYYLLLEVLIIFVSLFALVYLGGTACSYVVVNGKYIEIHTFLKKTKVLNVNDVKKTGVAQNYFVMADDLGNTLGYFLFSNVNTKDFVKFLVSKGIEVPDEIQKYFGLIEENVIDVDPSLEGVDASKLKALKDPNRSEYEEIGRHFRENFASYKKKIIIFVTVSTLVLALALIGLYFVMKSPFIFIFAFMLPLVVYTKVKELLNARKDITNKSDYELGCKYYTSDKRIKGYAKAKIKTVKSTSLMLGIIFLLFGAFIGYSYFTTKAPDYSLLTTITGEVAKYEYKEGSGATFTLLKDGKEDTVSYVLPALLEKYVDAEKLVALKNGTNEDFVGATLNIKVSNEKAATAYATFALDVTKEGVTTSYIGEAEINEYFQEYMTRYSIMFYVSIALVGASAIYYFAFYYYYKKDEANESIELFNKEENNSNTDVIDLTNKVNHVHDEDAAVNILLEDREKHQVDEKKDN
jgi:hypothetical protein